MSNAGGGTGKIEHLPTEEQERIILAMIDAIGESSRGSEEDEYGFLPSQTRGITIPAESPAGTGKTQTTLDLIERVGIDLPGKRIVYLIFNNFMKDEVKWRAKMRNLENADFFTLHGFLLNHALTNEKLHPFFHDNEGKPKIDFSKQAYTREDFSIVTTKILGFRSRPIESLLRLALNRYLSSTEISSRFYATFSKVFSKRRKEEVASLYGKGVADLSEKQREIFRVLSQIMDPIAEKLLKTKVASRARNLSEWEMLTLFLVYATQKLFNEQRLTHSAYYKLAYLYSMANDINLFEGYDAIIVDEAQDIDPIFLSIIEQSRLPKLLIGDRHQGIYAFRGSVNMMERASSKYGSYAMTYSFRFKNDIAAFSNKILSEKESSPEIQVVGKYTGTVSSIKGDRMLTNGEIADIVEGNIKKRISEAIAHFEEEKPSKIPKKKLKSFLSRAKTAIISRNNATLIKKIFEVERKIREAKLSEYVTMSLTSTISDEFKKIEKGDFDYRVQSRISEAIGTSYSKWKTGKSIEEILSNQDIRFILRDTRKYSFLTDRDLFENYRNLMESISSRKADSMQKEDKSANLVFTTAHGSKGKEFSTVILAEDFLAGEKIDDEELNLAYVAVSRAKEEIYFAEPSSPEDQNPLFQRFQIYREEIEREMRQPYLYRFPAGSSIQITNMGNIYKYEIENGAGEKNIFLDKDIIGGITAGISGSGDLLCIRGWVHDKNKGGYTIKFYTTDGEIVEEKDRIEHFKKNCRFYYATGAGSPEARESNRRQRSNVLNVSPGSREESKPEAGQKTVGPRESRLPVHNHAPKPL